MKCQMLEVFQQVIRRQSSVNNYVYIHMEMSTEVSVEFVLTIVAGEGFLLIKTLHRFFWTCHDKVQI